jgi:hypothetical protein
MLSIHLIRADCLEIAGMATARPLSEVIALEDKASRGDIPKKSFKTASALPDGGGFGKPARETDTSCCADARLGHLIALDRSSSDEPGEAIGDRCQRWRRRR